MALLASIFKFVFIASLATQAIASGCLRNNNVGSHAQEFTSGVFNKLPFSTTLLGLKMELSVISKENDPYELGYTLTSGARGACYMQLLDATGHIQAEPVRAASREKCSATDGPFEKSSIDQGFKLFVRCSI